VPEVLEPLHTETKVAELKIVEMAPRGSEAAEAKRAAEMMAVAAAKLAEARRVAK
jgi:hypothetical protein